MNYIYPDILLLCCDNIFSCVVSGWVLPEGFLPGRVWVWDKMYTHARVRVQVRVVGKILRHGCGFGYALPAPNGDGCHRYAHEMEINTRRLAIPCHILYMHVMFILYVCILFCFDRDGSIIRWSLTLNFKIKCVLPSYAPLRKIVVLKHLVMIRCYKLYVHIQRV
jgi:hypothetical protein